MSGLCYYVRTEATARQLNHDLQALGLNTCHEIVGRGAWMVRTVMQTPTSEQFAQARAVAVMYTRERIESPWYTPPVFVRG